MAGLGFGNRQQRVPRRGLGLDGEGYETGEYRQGDRPARYDADPDMSRNGDYTPPGDFASSGDRYGQPERQGPMGESEGPGDYPEMDRDNGFDPHQSLADALNAARSDDEANAAVDGWRKKMQSLGYTEQEINQMQDSILNEYGDGQGVAK